jgi:DNA-binding response OmpR family regulator
MRVLLVDDNESVRMTFAAILDDAGHAVTEADSVAAARTCLASGIFELALLDIHLGDGLGTALIPELRGAQPKIAIAVLSGGSGGERIDGADLVLAKGADPFQLLEQLERVVASR